MSGRQINTLHNAILSELQSAACFPQWLTHNSDFLYFWFLWKHVDRYGAQLTGELKAWAHLSCTGPVEAGGSIIPRQHSDPLLNFISHSSRG